MVAGALGRGKTDEYFGAGECIVEPFGASCDRIAFGLYDERRAADVGDAVSGGAAAAQLKKLPAAGDGFCPFL